MALSCASLACLGALVRRRCCATGPQWSVFANGVDSGSLRQRPVLSVYCPPPCRVYRPVSSAVSDGWRDPCHVWRAVAGMHNALRLEACRSPLDTRLPHSPFVQRRAPGSTCCQCALPIAFVAIMIGE